MKLHDKITIVVPCKNEETYIHYLLDALRLQYIGDTRIIIADCSTDHTRQVIKDNSYSLNVEIIDGGPVSIAKNRGAQMVTTPYILFIDADVRFFKDNVIRDAVKEIESKKENEVEQEEDTAPPKKKKAYMFKNIPYSSCY